MPRAAAGPALPDPLAAVGIANQAFRQASEESFADAAREAKQAQTAHGSDEGHCQSVGPPCLRERQESQTAAFRASDLPRCASVQRSPREACRARRLSDTA